MRTESMTFQEFQEQALRLHKRFPHTYTFRRQVELAFHLSGLPAEWFKTRVDYILKSGTKHYDWIGSSRGAKALSTWQADFAKSRDVQFTQFREQIESEIQSATGVSYEEFLKSNGAQSATELLEKVRKDSKDEAE